MGQTDAITTPRQLPDADQWLSGATQPASSTQGPPQPEQQGPQQSLPDADAWMENIQKQNYHDSVFPTIGRIITNTGVGYIEDAIKEGVNPLAPFGYVAKKAQESATSGFQQVPGFNSLVSKVSDMISPGSGAYGPQGITDETPVKDDLTAKAKSEGRALTTDEEEQIGAEAAMRPFGASTGIAFAPLAPLQPLFDGAIKEAQDRGMTKGNLALLNTALTVFSLHELLSHGSAPEIVTEGLANGTHTSEDVYMGLKDPTPAETEAAAIAAEKVPGFNLKRGTNLSTVDNTALEHELSSSEAPSSPSQDIHEAARKSDPETFKEWDALSRERDKHLDIINNLKSETPELDEYHRNKYSMQNDIEILKDKQEGANARKTKIYQKQIDDIQEKLDDLTAKNDVARESSSKLKEIENRQNDLSPKVIDAYKSVAGDEFTGKKSDPSFYPSTQPVDDSSTPLTVKGYVDDYIAGKGRDSLKHEQFAANNATEIEKEFQSRAGIKSPEDQHASIVSDIVKQATSKGYGVEEAQASAEVLARQYKYLSDIYGGAKGTAEELYNKEKPSIIKQGERLPKGKAPSVKTLAQGPAGKYHVLDSGLRVIRLMDSANESTLIHEGAHHFFDMMQRFEKEDGAPAKLKEDMALLRKEFGVKDGEDIQPTHEEKFARGFEAYLREGHAPTKALISVFQKFEKWLKAIYKTAKDIPNGQISDTVRNFFDRTLESNVALRDNPRNTVIAPERPGKMMADVHETDAKTTPPEHAAEVRDTVEKEIDKTAKLHDPEVADAIKSAETSDISESSTSDKDATVSEQPAGKTGSSEESGPLSASRNNSGRESAEARSESEPARSGNTTPGSPAAEPNRSAVSGAQYIKDGWFRLDKFNTSDDAKAMIRQAADQNSDFMDARYGSTAYKQAKEIEAANQLLVQAAESAAKITDKFAETGSAEDGAAYLRATQQLAIISNLAAEQRADWAHAGHQLQKQVIPENAANAAQTVMDASGKTLYQLQMEAKLVGKSKLSPKALGQLCEEARSSKFGKFNSVLLRIIFNSWLSNPITHLKYLTGIGITGLLKDTVQGAFEAGFSSLRGAKAGDKFYLGEIGAGLYGMGHGVRESLSAGTDAIKNGIMFMEGKVLPGAMNAIGHIFDTIRPPKDMAPEAMEMLRDAKNEAVKKGAFAETIDPQLALDKASSKTPEALAEKAKFPAIYAYLENAAKPADVDTTLGAEGPITSKIGYALTIPERAIAGIHTLGYSLHYGQEIARRAYRSAVDAGMIPDTDEFNTQVAKFTQRTPLKDIEEAHDEAIKMLMMKRPEYGTFLHTLIAASNRNVFAKLMLPFAQLASNRILLATEHTPFAYMLKDSREDLNGKNGGLAQDRARAKIATGTALAGLVIGLAAEGIITPNYSTDPKQRRNQQEQGFKPYSLKVGNVYIPLPKFLGQYGPLIGTFADLYHVGHLLTHEQHEKVAVALTASIGQNITDETFAGGISNAVQAAQDPAHFERYVGGIGMGLIPYSSGLNQLTKFTDPYHREAHGILEQIRAGNPLTSPSLYPTRDQWGERMASGTQSSFSIGHNDRVTQWLEKLDTGLTPVPKQIDNVKLTEGQYDEYAKLAGRTAKQMLIKLMNSNIQSRPPSEQVIKIKETVDNARNIARQTLKGQYPNIIKDANAAKRNIRTGHIQ